MRSSVKTLFTVEDMEPLRRSGRLGPVRQSVCTVLNVRPLLTCREGAVVSCGMVRGHNEQLRALDQAVPENAGCIVVQYIRNLNGARQLQHRLESRLNKAVLLRHQPRARHPPGCGHDRRGLEGILKISIRAF